MCRTDKKCGGFSLIEVIVSMALLLTVVLGFVTMTAANAKVMTGVHRRESSMYRLAAMAENGEGTSTGEMLELSFTLKGGLEEGERAETEELFDVCSVSESMEGGESRLIYYRH